MMNLVVDVGNTRTKFALFKENQFVDGGVGWDELYLRVGEIRRVGEGVNVILSSTGEISMHTRERLQGMAAFFCEAVPTMELPIRLAYETPYTLGIDRVAGCVGGAFLFPGKDLLIVDVGTAITFDFMRGDGEFLGGNISPGIGMRLRALHEFTEHLPLVDCSMEYGEVGRNTRDALLNGVMRGILLEVQGYIDAWRREKKDAFVVITGGGRLFLKESLKREVCFEEKLVFIGLNRLLEYQKKS